MPDIPELHVPYCENPGTRQIDNFEAVCQSLGEHGLIAADLLYVGVEGKPFLDGIEPSERRSTWGCTYLSALTGYQEEANGSSSNHFDVLLWAARPRRIVPALVTYDTKQLVPESSPTALGQWWAHKDGGSVTKALRALVYLDLHRRDPISDR